jgi:glycosyltransferase involved in cell wall biosynthesis
MTFFNEGPLISGAIQSVLGQSYRNFELILVDDGSTNDTAQYVEQFDDPRIRMIQQANDGLSSARNRAISLATGNYICFLDADDARPFWAFESMKRVIDDGQPDLIFCRGILSELRNELIPFYDGHLFDDALALLEGRPTLRSNDPRFGVLLAIAQLIEPQSANKAVKTSYLKRYHNGFPNGHFFEDIFFHTACIATAGSVGFVDDPAFTYFRRFGRPQITASSDSIRFDAIAVARMTLQYFEGSPRFDNSLLRAAVLASVGRMVDWCGKSISHHHRFHFNELYRFVLSEISPLYGELNPELPPFFGKFVPALDSVRGKVRSSNSVTA